MPESLPQKPPKSRKSFVNRLRRRVFCLELKRNTWQALVPYDGQRERISEALVALRKAEGSAFLLESAQGEGKTYTVLLLLRDIGLSEMNYELFSRFNSSVYYLDCSSASESVQSFLEDIGAPHESILLVDNAQRLSQSNLLVLQCGLESIIEAAKSRGQTQLSIVTTETGLVPHHGVFGAGLRTLSKRPRNADDGCDVTCDSGGNLVFQPNSQSGEFSVSASALQLDGPQGDCAQLLQWISDDSSLNQLLQRRVVFFAALVSVSMYSELVDERDLCSLCRRQGLLRKSEIRSHEKYFIDAGVVRPFPLAKRSLLMSESTSRACRKLLHRSKQFAQAYYSTVSWMCHVKLECDAPDAWFYLTACELQSCSMIDDATREKAYGSCVQRFNKDYVLRMLEDEIALCPEKEGLFVNELADLRIETGAWTDARTLLDKWIFEAADDSVVWKARLRLAEACHGEDAESSLKDLEALLLECDDPYIRMQSKYWIAHVKMEMGDFNLKPWVDVHQIIKEHPEWKSNRNYGHIVHRATADYCRTYFLRGGCQHELDSGITYDFEQAINFFDTCAAAPLTQGDEALRVLENAHLIHYNEVYQLGVTKRRFSDNPHIEGVQSEMNLTQYIDLALKLYDESIALFKKDGYKTWRTAQIRHDELSLCTDSCNYAVVIGNLDAFIAYATENKVNVFIAYAKTLRGKAQMIQAVSYMENGDEEYESLLRQASCDLDSSAREYASYKNRFGEFRAWMLKQFADTFIEIELTREFDAAKLVGALQKKARACLMSRENNMREYQIIDEIERHADEKQLMMHLHRIVKYYPVVLQ